jgi:hypothetical protein
MALSRTHPSPPARAIHSTALALLATHRIDPRRGVRAKATYRGELNGFIRRVNSVLQWTLRERERAAAACRLEMGRNYLGSPTARRLASSSPSPAPLHACATTSFVVSWARGYSSSLLEYPAHFIIDHASHPMDGWSI